MAVFYAVPRGTPAAVCSIAECGRKVYFVELGNSKKLVAVDVDVPCGKPPTKNMPGHGVLHRLCCKESHA